MSSNTKAYYPIFTDLEGRKCVVIGGGPIAQRKVTTLLGCGAQVTVVSPTLTKRLLTYAHRGVIRHIARRFRPADLRGAWLVVAATDDQHINELVYRAATARRIFTNVVDHKPLCSFIAPAIFRRGLLTVAVSTGGASPSLAKKVRSDLARTIGSDYAPMLRLLTSLRGVAKRTLPSYHDRKRYFDRLVHGRVFKLMQAGKARQARHVALDVLARSAHPSTRTTASGRGLAQDSAPSLGPRPRDSRRGIPSGSEGRASKKVPRVLPVGLHKNGR